MTKGKGTAIMGAVVLGSVGVMTVVGCTGADEGDDTTTIASALETFPFGHGPCGKLGPFGKKRSPTGLGKPGRACRGEKSVPIVPDATGWISGSSNSLGIQGPWYAYGDGYGSDGARLNGSCQTAGHADAECSVITAPVPAQPFANSGGVMCTSGTSKVILTVGDKPVTDPSPTAIDPPDYSHMWGDGIGFNLADPGTGGPTGIFNASAKKVIGVSFDINNVPPGLRVEFPTPTSDASTLGSDYWGATASYPPSPVVAGTNVILFSAVASPEATPVPLDTTILEAVQFLVPSNIGADQPFSYCVSNVKFVLASH
jgi:hypothetical protein